MRHFLLKSLIVLLSICVLFTHQAFALSVILTTDTHDYNEQTGSANIFYELNPGESLKGTFYVNRKIRLGDPDTVELDYAVVDASMTSNGYVGMASDDSEQQFVGNWLELDRNTTVLRETDAVDFSLQIPKNATPGEYYGGFIISAVDTASQKKGNTKVKVRFAYSFMVRVLGSVEPSFSQSATRVKKTLDGKSIVLDITNTGNVALHYTGTITLKSLFKEQSFEYFDRTILPGADIVIEEPISALHFGPVHKTVDFQYFYKQSPQLDDLLQIPSSTLSGRFYAFSMSIFLLLLFIFALIYVTIYRYVKKVNQAYIIHRAKKKDTVYGLSEKYNVPWQKIARINHLKPPYLLSVDQEIKIPDDSTAQKKI